MKTLNSRDQGYEEAITDAIDLIKTIRQIHLPFDIFYELEKLRRSKTFSVELRDYYRERKLVGENL